MKIKYDKTCGHRVALENFTVFFSNRFCDLNYLRSNTKIEIDGLDFETGRMAICDQVHSDRYVILNRQHCGAGIRKPEIAGYDAMITDDRFIIPVVKSADCTPVILVDPLSGARAAIHSGREGTRRGVVTSTLLGLIDTFSAEVDNLLAFIGPSIGAENYEVSEEIFLNFVRSTGVDQPHFRKLDIKKVIVSQLKSLGIKSDKIIIIEEDTYSNDDFYSYRRDRATGRQIALVADKK